MSTEPEIAVTHGPRKLGLVGKAVVGLMVVVTVGLVVGGGIAIRAKGIEEEPRPRTLATMEHWARELYRWERVHGARLSNGDTDHGDALGANRGLDGWRHLIRYRCPGPVHKNGFDLISAGPNGVFEDGGGDDIVVGEDLPGGVATISSESRSR